MLAPPGTASAAVNARPHNSSTHNTRAGSDRFGRLPWFGIRGTWHRGDGRGGEEEEEEGEEKEGKHWEFSRVYITAPFRCKSALLI